MSQRRGVQRSGVRRKVVLLAGLGALYLLHNDFWNWDAPHRLSALWGLPAGFVWHVAYCLAAAGWMWVMVRRWPAAPGPHPRPLSQPTLPHPRERGAEHGPTASRESRVATPPPLSREGGVAGWERGARGVRASGRAARAGSSAERPGVRV